MNDLVFGPAITGSMADPVQHPVLDVDSKPLAVRKQKVSKPSPPTEAQIVFITRPEDLRLIRIPDRNAPDWCEVCGIEHGLFWTGSMVMCIQCSKDAKLFKKEGLPFIDKAKTPQEFFEWLRHQKYLMRRLFDARA